LVHLPDLWFGHRILLVQNFIPIEAMEERVLFDGFGVSEAGAKTRAGITVHQLQNY
jgi:hypothetical protein